MSRPWTPLAPLLASLVLLAPVAQLLSTSSAAAAFPGTNGKILYDHESDIQTINPDGSGNHNLTSAFNSGYDIDGAWSPDGQKIAFQSDEDGTGARIWVMNANGSTPVKITSATEGDDVNPAWAPDMAHIAFSSDVAQVDATIFDIYKVAAIAGSTPVQLTTSGGNTRPTWSPDGTKIAYQHDEAGNNSQIWVMNADGTGQTNIGDGSQPDWSPDGTQIAFIGVDDDNVYRMPAAGGTATAVTTNTTLQNLNGDGANDGAGNPAWSPDGTKIVFGDDVANVPTNVDVFTTNASGTPGTPALVEQGCDCSPLNETPNPSWQPLPVADLQVSQSASPDPAVEITHTLTYTVTVANAVSSTSWAYGVKLTDPLPAGVMFGSLGVSPSSAGFCAQAAGVVTCVFKPMQQGASAQVTVTVTVPSHPAALTDTATVASTDPLETDLTPANDTSSTPTTVFSVADLSVTKTAPATAFQGQDFAYALTVHNGGPDPAFAAAVTDVLPADVSFVAASAGCSNTAGTVTCALGVLQSGATANLSITGLAGTPGGSLNTATVASALPDQYENDHDADLTNNSSNASTTIDPAPSGSADLAVAGSAPASAVHGSKFALTFKVTNTGPDPAAAANLSVPLPQRVTFFSAPSGCSNEGGTVECDLADMTSGASVTVTITVTAASLGTASAIGTASSPTSDPTTSNNSAGVHTTITAPPNYRPDALIGIGAHALVGNNVYSAVATGETKKARVIRGKSVTFTIKLQNDGSRDSFAVKGPGSRTGFTVKYLVGSSNVTTRIKAGTYSTPKLATGRSIVLKLVVKLSRTLKKGTSKSWLITAASAGAPTKKDAVKAIIVAT